MPCYIKVRLRARKLNLQSQLPSVSPSDREIQLELNAIDHDDVDRILNSMSDEDFKKFLQRLNRRKAPELEAVIYG